MEFLKPSSTRDSFASTKWKTIARLASHFPSYQLHDSHGRWERSPPGKKERKGENEGVNAGRRKRRRKKRGFVAKRERERGREGGGMMRSGSASGNKSARSLIAAMMDARGDPVTRSWFQKSVPGIPGGAIKNSMHPRVRSSPNVIMETGEITPARQLPDESSFSTCILISKLMNVSRGKNVSSVVNGFFERSKL